MKRRIYPVILSSLIIGLVLINGVSPAFAATKHATTANTPSALGVRAARADFHPRGWLTHNQYFHGNSYSGLHLTMQGHNQNNIGNQGYNRGYNRDFGANGGNLIVNHDRARYQRTNQYFAGHSYSNNDLNLFGYDQNNTGNQGTNDGYSEDNAGNGGNQMVN